MTQEQLNMKLIGLPAKIESSIQAIVKANEDEIVKRNRGQLMDGMSSNGKKLGEYKSNSWINKRKKKGKQVQFVDLNFSGDWQGSFYAKADANGVLIGAKNIKEWGGKDVLVHHWGEDIYGLSEENFDWLFNVITDSLYNELKAYFT